MAERKHTPRASDADIAKLVTSGTDAGNRLRDDLARQREAFLNQMNHRPAIGPTAIKKKRDELAAGKARFRRLGLK